MTLHQLTQAQLMVEIDHWANDFFTKKLFYHHLINGPFFQLKSQISYFQVNQSSVLQLVDGL